MNSVKGFRFHPTEEELIEFLQLKTFDRDSSVQVIDEVSDFCSWEPCQLAESSTLQTGDRLWYFMYSPKYKYPNNPNSKLINRSTKEGYWKPTGNARKIINPKTGVVIGTKKTLVFYKGKCNDKNKIKTCWVMHEYELQASLNTSDIDQKTFNLCKLKKRKLDISSTDTSQLSPHNDCENIGNQADNIESYVGERSNQHNAVNDDVVCNLSTSFVNPVAEDAISKETLHLKEMSKECNGSKDDNGFQNLYSTIEKDDESCGSVLTNGDNTILTERSNQHNVIVASEGFGVPSSFQVLTNGDETIPIERSNQHNIIVAAGGSGVPSSFEFFTNGDEIIPIERSNQHNVVVAFEGFGVPSSFEDLTNGDKIIPIEESSQHDAIIAAEGFRVSSSFKVLTNGDETIPIERSNQHNVTVVAEGYGVPSSCEVLTNGEETIPVERSNQRNVIAAVEGFEVPSSFEYLAGDKLGSMDFQYDEGLSIDELLEELEATNNSNWIQNLDDEFWDSDFGHDSKACLQEENRHQCLATETEVSSLCCIGVMESSDSLENPKKRPRLSHDVHVKTT